MQKMNQFTYRVHLKYSFQEKTFK